MSLCIFYETKIQITRFRFLKLTKQKNKLRNQIK